jgi:amino acid transporter
MQNLYGHEFSTSIALLIPWCMAGSLFMGMLGISRIPYAAARDGQFFKVFGRIHPRFGIPHVSLLFIGLLTAILSLFDLGFLFQTLVVLQVVIQFIGQIVAVILVRRKVPPEKRPFKMLLFPIPIVIAAAGWIYILAISGLKPIFYALGAMGAGFLVYLIMAFRRSFWPFDPSET